MRITVELSLYPLTADFTAPITAYIHDLRAQPGLEVITNQMSTQLRGNYDTVLAAVARCTRRCMEQVHPVVLVAKFINADLDIASPPAL